MAIFFLFFQIAKARRIDSLGGILWHITKLPTTATLSNNGKDLQEQEHQNKEKFIIHPLQSFKLFSLIAYKNVTLVT
jgi:hypothetical protein